MKKLLNSIYEAIGETPMGKLSRITKHYHVDGQIFAKLEYLNPGFSKKDRPALQMIEEAKASGELLPGQPVVELTSGNTGTGLSIVCKAKGHPFIACMSEGNSVERARMMKALSAEVARNLASLEGAFVGFSSGANVAAAIQLLRGKEKGNNIVLTLNDSGLKYLSTDLFE